MSKSLTELERALARLEDSQHADEPETLADLILQGARNEQSTVTK